jgi:hypothetical protein
MVRILQTEPGGRAGAILRASHADGAAASLADVVVWD